MALVEVEQNPLENRYSFEPEQGDKNLDWLRRVEVYMRENRVYISVSTRGAHPDAGKLGKFSQGGLGPIRMRGRPVQGPPTGETLKEIFEVTPSFMTRELVNSISNLKTDRDMIMTRLGQIRALQQGQDGPG